jgi:hypothetical protein
MLSSLETSTLALRYFPTDRNNKWVIFQELTIAGHKICHKMGDYFS